MKNSKKFFILIMVFLVIGVIIFWINKKDKNTITNMEYEPQEEISMTQERKTMVSLYFKNKTTKEIEPEARLIDVKELVDDPYNTIVKLLIDGPKKETLEKVIPEGTKVNNMSVDGDTLIIDFSKEFIENHEEGKEAEQITIESIVKTFTELTEIDSIKILINGEENQQFKDGKIKFNNIFMREE